MTILDLVAANIQADLRRDFPVSDGDEVTVIESTSKPGALAAWVATAYDPALMNLCAEPRHYVEIPVSPGLSQDVTELRRKVRDALMSA